VARTLFALALVLAVQGQPRVPGFKETVKLVVSGPGIAKPIESTDPDAIAANVFGGNFLTTIVDAPDPYWPRYRVAFHINSRERGVFLAYVVLYVWNPLAREGFVYLPGRGDADYRLNSGTIIRDGSDSPGQQPARDGYWHHATADWSRAVNRAIG
jgi:hypothetical protein